MKIESRGALMALASEAERQGIFWEEHRAEPNTANMFFDLADIAREAIRRNHTLTLNIQEKVFPSLIIKHCEQDEQLRNTQQRSGL